jgi:hypothetical protein
MKTTRGRGLLKMLRPVSRMFWLMTVEVAGRFQSRVRTVPIWSPCLQGLHRVSATTPEADAFLVEPGLESSADRLRFFACPPAQMWQEEAKAHFMWLTVARLFGRRLALAASEAHCEPVIASLGKMVGRSAGGCARTLSRRDLLPRGALQPTLLGALPCVGGVEGSWQLA